MRELSDRNILDRFCEKFCGIVDTHCRYIIVSGFVAISSGRVRGTEDIDLIIERLSKEQLEALHHDLIDAGFVCMQSASVDEIFSYLKDNLAVRYTLSDKPLPEMEMKFAKDALDNEQLQLRTKLPLTGIDIWFGSIPMNIAFKEELLKSDKDLKDAEHLRKVYPELADEREILRLKVLIRRIRL